MEYFKIEKKYETTIQLEDKDSVVDGIGEGGSQGINEEPTDFLSEIIQTLNDSFDGDFDEEDKVRIEKIQNQIYQHEDLRRVMEGDNSDSNKRDMFNKTFESLLVGLVGQHLDFYNKLSSPKRNRFMKDRMYDNYSRSMMENRL